MIITPKLLERGDKFIMSGLEYHVRKITGNYAYYTPTSSAYGMGNIRKIGIRSSEKITMTWDGKRNCKPEDLKNHFKILPESI